MATFTTSVQSGILAFAFEGDLDTLSCMELEESVTSEIKTHKGKIVFDLKGVEYIASSFIRLCGASASLVGSQNFSLTNVNKEIKNNLTKLGLASVLNIK